MLVRHKGAAHRLDRIDRENGGRMADFQSIEMRPVPQVLGIIAGLCLHRICSRLINGGIDRIEDAAHQDRPPDQVRLMPLRDFFNLTESQVGPRTRTVVEKLKLLGHWSAPLAETNLML